MFEGSLKWKLPLALFACAAWLELASCSMVFALYLQLAQVFDTFGENPHNSEQTELMLQQQWKAQFVTAMSQPVQLVLCGLLLNLCFRHLWLIYSSITTSHYCARYDILKTKSDSDGVEKNSGCKIISEPFQRPQRCVLFFVFFYITDIKDSGVCYHLFSALFSYSCGFEMCFCVLFSCLLCGGI